MNHKVMIAAGQQCFEFLGQIVELEQDYLILRAKHGDIYIERKYLVFIQYMNEDEEEKKEIAMPVSRPSQVDAAAKFVARRLKHDPLDERLEEKLIPPSQLPDDDYDEDEEVRNQIERLHGKKHPLTQPENLSDAIKHSMKGGNEDFALSFGGSKYADVAQTILDMKNAGNKKNRIG